MNIITEQPFWLIIFCLLAAFLYSGILYYRDNSFSELPKAGRLLMAALRFTAVFLISILLLNPLLKTIMRHTEKPLVILALDNSRSLLGAKDSVFNKTQLPAKLDALAGLLKDEFELRRFTAGEKITEQDRFAQVQFDGRQTDLSQLFAEIRNKYSNRNIGAVLLASDGLYNQGENPLFGAEALKVPVYTIAVGDTEVRKDVLIQGVSYNKTVFLGNDFPLEINVLAKKSAGAVTRLTVMEDSTVIYSKAVSITSGQHLVRENVVLHAKKRGSHKYRIALSPVEGEATVLNNRTDIFIEVLEQKQQILVLAASPHPDLSAIRQVLESGSQYEVKIRYAGDSDIRLQGHDLIILHQLPTKEQGLQSLAMPASKVPVLYIIGNQTNIQEFNGMQQVLKISSGLNKTNDASPELAPGFSLFTVSDEHKRKISQYPPLTVPFGTYRLAAGSTPLLMQRLGSVVTENPLIVFSAGSEQRNGVIAGEGLWRCRLHEYDANASHEAFDNLILKSVQYLSLREDKKPFRIVSRKTFRENEPVIFDAELYNESRELINEPDVQLTIKDASSKSFPFTFSKTERSYSLNAGFFSPGSYTYAANVKHGEKVHRISGEFTVTEVQVEFAETAADFGLLYRLAKNTGGEMRSAATMDDLAALLMSREDVKPVIYSEDKLSELINIKWVFFIILLLLASEWFYRKRSGGY